MGHIEEDRGIEISIPAANIIYKVTIHDNTGTYTLEEWRALPEWHDRWDRMVGDLKLYQALTRRSWPITNEELEQPNPRSQS